MEFLPQRRNRRIYSLLAFFLLTLAPVLAGPVLAGADFLAYDPEVDVVIGAFSYFTPHEENAPGIKPGPYFGAYLSMKSPIFTYFFNSRNIYNIFEIGCSMNEIEQEFGSTYMVNLPISIDFAYRFSPFEKFSILPFLGFGVGFALDTNSHDEGPPLYPFVKAGVELRYLIWEDTHIRIKIDYGIAFVDEFETGFVPFLRVRFPIPFIP